MTAVSIIHVHHIEKSISKCGADVYEGNIIGLTPLIQYTQFSTFWKYPVSLWVSSVLLKGIPWRYYHS